MSDAIPALSMLLVTAWPLLAACMLGLVPADRLASASGLLAPGGLVLTLLLTPLLHGEDALADTGRILAASVPFLARPAGGRPGVIVPFLAASCVLLGLTVRSVLPAVALTGLATALLGVAGAAGARRVATAWASVRPRLAGTVFALLGAAFLMLPGSPAETGRAGELFLAVGLCLMAGLGGTEDSPEGSSASLLVTLPRLGALALMLRLAEGDVTRMVFLVAGLTTLWLRVLARRGDVTAALVALCAAAGDAIPAALLFLCAGLGVACVPFEPGRRGWMDSALPPGPVFTGAVLLLRAMLPSHPVAGSATLAALGAGASRVRCRWPRRFAREDAAFWAMVALGLAAPLLLLRSWPLAWRA